MHPVADINQTPKDGASPGSEIPAREYRFPDFLCIGAQKAGTTWLDANLRRHPGLWLPPVKELHYFNELYIPAHRKWTGESRRRRGAAVLERYVQKVPAEKRDQRYIERTADIAQGAISDEWYGRIFALAAPNQVCGEITPDYCTLPEKGIRHIVRLMPEVKIVLSLRDPIERSWSHLRMLSKAKGGIDPAQLERLAQSKDFIQRADYATMIGEWRKHIPDARFLILFADDMIVKPLAVLETVCGFLVVAFDERHFSRAANAVHVGEPLEIPASVLAILKKSLRPVYDRIARLYPEIVAAWAARHY